MKVLKRTFVVACLLCANANVHSKDQLSIEFDQLVELSEKDAAQKSTQPPAGDGKEAVKLFREVFEDSSILTASQINKLKNLNPYYSRYQRYVAEIYTNQQLFTKTGKLTRSLVDGNHYTAIFSLVDGGWYILGETALGILNEKVRTYSEARVPWFGPSTCELWEKCISKLIGEKIKLIEIAKAIKPANDIERFLLTIAVRRAPYSFMADLPRAGENNYTGDDESARFIEKPDAVPTIDAPPEVIAKHEYKMRCGKFIYLNKYIYMTLGDMRSGRIQFIFNSNPEYCYKISIKILNPDATNKKTICFIYYLNDKQSASLAKLIPDVMKLFKVKLREIREWDYKMFEIEEDKEKQKMCEKNDIAASRKPRDAFPATWAEKRRIEEFMKKLDLDGLKKYVKGKNVNFNYVHKDYSSLEPVIEATEQDKTPKRFVEFLNFMVPHGFDMHTSGRFNSYNPLKEAVIEANYQAFMELIRRGVKCTIKFYHNKTNLLQSAQSILDYYDNITPDARKYYPDIVKMKERRAKTLKERIIPYLKSLKDPKTGKHLFKSEPEKEVKKTKEQ